MRFILGILQIFVAIMAIPAAIMLIMDTSGESLGLNLEILQSSPFSDFLIPGLFLLLVNGLGSMIGAFWTFRQSLHAAKAAMVLGLILIGWILIQVYFIGMTHFLQPLFLFVGIAELLMGYLWFKEQNRS